jgi:hypothetical protein
MKYDILYSLFSSVVEQLICNQEVRGSNPLTGRNKYNIFTLLYKNKSEMINTLRIVNFLKINF